MTRSQENCSRGPARAKDVERRNEARRDRMMIPTRRPRMTTRYSFEIGGKIGRLSRSSARRSVAVVRDEVAAAAAEGGVVEAEDVRQVNKKKTATVEITWNFNRDSFQEAELERIRTTNPTAKAKERWSTTTPRAKRDKETVETKRLVF